MALALALASTFLKTLPASLAKLVSVLLAMLFSLNTPSTEKSSTLALNPPFKVEILSTKILMTLSNIPFYSFLLALSKEYQALLASLSVSSPFKI